MVEHVHVIVFFEINSTFQGLIPDLFTYRNVLQRTQMSWDDASYSGCDSGSLSHIHPDTWNESALAAELQGWVKWDMSPGGYSWDYCSVWPPFSFQCIWPVKAARVTCFIRNVLNQMQCGFRQHDYFRCPKGKYSCDQQPSVLRVDSYRSLRHPSAEFCSFIPLNYQRLGDSMWMVIWLFWIWLIGHIFEIMFIDLLIFV